MFNIRIDRVQNGVKENFELVHRSGEHAIRRKPDPPFKNSLENKSRSNGSNAFKATIGPMILRRGRLTKPKPHCEGRDSLLFPCPHLSEVANLACKSWVQSSLGGNSQHSLRRSLLLGQNLRVLGRMCGICRSKRKNSLLNSLRQGICSSRQSTRAAGFDPRQWEAQGYSGLEV
jgi:hypothetical protein